MIFASLTMLCLLCAPTLAQSSSPSASQYEPCPPGSDSDACAASSVADSPDGAVDNAARGTDAVNGAMEGPAASDSAPASPEAVLSSEDASSPGPGGAATGGGSGSIARLPETGGASFAVLGWGVALVAFGLMARRVVGR